MSVAQSASKAGKKSTAKPAAAVALGSALAQAEVLLVALSALVKSPLNVRTRPYPAESVRGLADTIAAQGLLQNLVVHAMPQGQYGVVCGGRRLTAMALLRDDGRLAADTPVPVKVVPEHLAVAASMTENGQQKAMHPVEQLAGFRRLADDGLTPEQTGDLLGYSSRHVRRCLALASLSPALLDALGRDEITLEQCQALCLEPDPARQVQIWEQACRNNCSMGSISVSYLRRLVTEREISTGTDWFRFVGEAAYTAAGGTVRTDLFSESGEGFVDPVLTKQLVLDRLTAEADRLKTLYGLAWAEAREDALTSGGSDRERFLITGLPDPVYTGEEMARMDRLYECLESCDNHDDENRDAQEIDDIEQAGQQRAMTPEWCAAHGVVVSYSSGDFFLQYAALRDAGTENSTAAATGGVTDMTPPPKEADAFSATLVRALTSDRTLAVQAALAGQPRIALALLTWTLAQSVFGMCARNSPLQVRIDDRTGLKSNTTAGNDARSVARIQTLEQEWAARLPADWKAHFTWLLTWPEADVLALLGFCVACGIDGVQERLYGRTRDSELDALETAMGFDLRDWWHPTAAGYFSQVSKAQIAEALTEAGLADLAPGALKMKKGDAAALAEQEISRTRWVPGWLKPAAAAHPQTLNTIPDHAA